MSREIETTSAFVFLASISLSYEYEHTIKVHFFTLGMYVLQESNDHRKWWIHVDYPCIKCSHLTAQKQ